MVPEHWNVAGGHLSGCVVEGFAREPVAMAIDLCSGDEGTDGSHDAQRRCSGTGPRSGTVPCSTLLGSG